MIRANEDAEAADLVSASPTVDADDSSALVEVEADEGCSTSARRGRSQSRVVNQDVPATPEHAQKAAAGKSSQQVKQLRTELITACEQLTACEQKLADNTRFDRGSSLRRAEPPRTASGPGRAGNLRRAQQRRNGERQGTVAHVRLIIIAPRQPSPAAKGRLQIRPSSTAAYVAATAVAIITTVVAATIAAVVARAAGFASAHCRVLHFWLSQPRFSLVRRVPRGIACTHLIGQTLSYM